MRCLWNISVEVSSKEWDIEMQNTGKMSGWRLKVISVIKEKIICTRERQNKGCGYSEEEGKTGGGEDEKDFVLKVTWKLGSYLWWKERGTLNTVEVRQRELGCENKAGNGDWSEIVESLLCQAKDVEGFSRK